MRLDVRVVGAEQIGKAMRQAEGQARFATSVALNKTADIARTDIRSVMRSVFDRPTPWVLNSLRVMRATKASLVAEVGFKDKNLYDDSRTMIEPHVHSVRRHRKTMEVRLFRAGLLPAGWSVVPGNAAKLDAFGNMSAGQISQILNVLGTYTEAGYNKANAKTIERLAKGNAKKGVAGFVYWVNPVSGRQKTHLKPGVYQRVSVGAGRTSLKPVMIFVPKISYASRLDFYGIINATVRREFPSQFDAAFSEAMRTSILRRQGILL